jgi:hypothetical protein
MPSPASGRVSGVPADTVFNQREGCVQFGVIDRRWLGAVLDGEFMNSRFLEFPSVTYQKQASPFVRG